MKQTPRDEWHDPQEPRNLSGVQFQYIHPGAPKQHPKLHTIQANDANGRYLGHMDWYKRTGEISNINVIGRVQGLGVATSMHEKATKLAADTGIKAPQHSRSRTDKGDAWARKVGGSLPTRAKEPDEEE